MLDKWEVTGLQLFIWCFIRVSFTIARFFVGHIPIILIVGLSGVRHPILLGVDEDSLDHLLEQVSTRNGDAPYAIIGGEVIEQVDFLKDAADMVRKHHVPIDKVRRPYEIPIGARIINVASQFDKLTKIDRPDGRLTAYQAISRIKGEQGIRFDPKVVIALINILRKQGRLMEFVS